MDVGLASGSAALEDVAADEPPACVRFETYRDGGVDTLRGVLEALALFLQLMLAILHTADAAENVSWQRKLL